MPAAIFRLKVQKIEQTCLFELSWGNGQQLNCTLNYPQLLAGVYQEWQRIYLSFYKSAFRGWVEDSGSIVPPPIDWQARLVQAEAKLLYEFHHWLRSAELFEIRATIAQGLLESRIIGSYKEESTPTTRNVINVFLTCEPIDLARLPWEAWEIKPEFPNELGEIRIVRTPKNIRQASDQTQVGNNRRKKARIIAILGDETGLNFQADREAVLRCARIAEIKFLGWQPGESIPELKAKIYRTLADECGWDVLFFAGHSNEMQLVGGELAIAPNVSLSIREISPYLQTAKSNGLKFALFNSCSGINIAESLIDLGFSQVVVMREPIHNTVAQAFLLKFLQVLADHQDVYNATIAACEYLKLKNSSTYPSAFLIPSLFCHPDAVPFRIPPAGWKQQLKQLLPTRTEAAALTILTVLSLCHPVQDFLLERRVWLQAVYRHVTRQIPISTSPPVLLVQIDEKSIRLARIADPKPIDRKYLAKLVDKLSSLNAKVIGIDYLLDRPQGESDRILSQSLRSAIQKQPSPPWFVFASVRDEDAGWLTVLPEIASPNWSLQGYVNLTHWYVGLLPEEEVNDFEIPFAYSLALAYQLNITTDFPANSKIQPDLNSKNLFLSQINARLKRTQRKSYRTVLSPQIQIQPLTNFAYDWGQMWGQPILDFSIPPDQVYQSIPAWQLLKSSTDSPQFRHLQKQVVIVAAGGYSEAGVFQEGQDNYSLPAATRYWLKLKHQNTRRSFTGGEAHTYIVHHFLKSWLVIPIPDLWMIGVAVLLGKGVQLTLKNPLTWRGRVLLLTGILVYGLLSLQLYVSTAYLLPLFLPIAMLLIYMVPVVWRKK